MPGGAATTGSDEQAPGGTSPDEVDPAAGPPGPGPLQSGGPGTRRDHAVVPADGASPTADEGTPLPGGLPGPPQPPFVTTPSGGFEVELPSALGRTVTIGVDDVAVTLAGERVPYDHIAGVRFRVEVNDALLRRAASARMTVEVTRTDGSSVRVSARNAASARRAEAIVETLGYLWDLLGGTAGVRQRDDLLRRLDRGGEVQVGGLRLTGIGIAWKRDPIVPWSAVGDPTVEDLAVVIPTDGRPIRTSMAAEDAYMLPSLIPAVRRHIERSASE